MLCGYQELDSNNYFVHVKYMAKFKKDASVIGVTILYIGRG